MTYQANTQAQVAGMLRYRPPSLEVRSLGRVGSHHAHTSDAAAHSWSASLQPKSWDARGNKSALRMRNSKACKAHLPAPASDFPWERTQESPSSFAPSRTTAFGRMLWARDSLGPADARL